MPRQVLSPIDLRTQAQRQGITRTQQTVQSIANILQIVGLAEQKRRERQTLDRITRAISQGATTIEAISAATKQEPEFGTGFRGGLQRIGGMFQPSPGGMGQNIQQAIIGQKIEESSPLYQAQLESAKARAKYYGRPQKPTTSPIMKMVGEGLITLDEGKELARKDKEGDLGEKDIISIMHTIERALASTYTVLNEPIEGKKYAERRNYYAQQLEIYRERLDQLRDETPDIDFTGPGAGGVPGWDAESLGLSKEMQLLPPSGTIEPSALQPTKTMETTDLTKLKDVALEADKWLEPKTPLATDQLSENLRKTIDKYPTPKTEKTFNNTISHIYPEKNRKFYFEIMLKRIAQENPTLAKKIYDTWSDKVYAK